MIDQVDAAHLSSKSQYTDMSCHKKGSLLKDLAAMLGVLLVVSLIVWIIFKLLRWLIPALWRMLVGIAEGIVALIDSFLLRRRLAPVRREYRIHEEERKGDSTPWFRDPVVFGNMISGAKSPIRPRVVPPPYSNHCEHEVEVVELQASVMNPQASTPLIPAESIAPAVVVTQTKPLPPEKIKCPIMPPITAVLHAPPPASPSSKVAEQPTTPDAVASDTGDKSPLPIETKDFVHVRLFGPSGDLVYSEQIEKTDGGVFSAKNTMPTL